MSTATDLPYQLDTYWCFDAPIEQVWEALHAVESWPSWWCYVAKVELIEQGVPGGLGRIHRYTWRSRLPYSLSFQMRVTRIEKPFIMEGEAQGELAGVGRWTLREEQNKTHVHYYWAVATGKRWMNALAPLLAPAFRWNHHQVMAQGERGLVHYLNQHSRIKT